MFKRRCKRGRQLRDRIHAAIDRGVVAEQTMRRQSLDLIALGLSLSEAVVELTRVRDEYNRHLLVCSRCQAIIPRQICSS